MPKSRQTPQQQSNALLTATIKKYMSLRGLKAEDIALSLNTTQRTVYNRFNSPDNLTVWELQKIIRKLQIPADEMSFILKPQ